MPPIPSPDVPKPHIDYKRLKLIERVRKMIALAERAGTKEEADAARRRADELRAKHDITDEEIDDEDALPGLLVVKSKRFRASWRTILWKLTSLPLRVAFARRLDEAGGGPRAILKGIHGDCKEAKRCYLHFEKIIEEAAYLQPEAHTDAVWRKDFCRGAAQSVGVRWRDYCRLSDKQKAAATGKLPPPMPMEPQGPMAGETIFIEPVTDRIAYHVGIRFGNGFDMPPPRKPKKKKHRRIEPKLLGPMPIENT